MSIIFALIIKGASSIIVQGLIVRELFVLFLGNEFSLGIILGNWILLEALGAAMLRKVKINNKQSLYARSQTILAVTLPFIIFFIRNCRFLFGKFPGESFNIWQIFLISLFALAPYCLIDGSLFFLGSRMLSKKNSKVHGVNSAYILESFGFIIGAIILSLLWIEGYLGLKIILIISVLNLANSIIVLTAQKNKNSPTLIINSLLIVFIAVLSWGDKNSLLNRLENISQKDIYPGFKVLKTENSLYSNIAVGLRENQYNIFVNGLTYTTMPFADQEQIEALTHFALLAHPDPKKILIIGNACGIIKECLKYQIERLDYLEPDTKLLEILKEFSSKSLNYEFESDLVRIICKDARDYLTNSLERYDVIIINYPEPSTIQLNRFFTKEFFSLASKSLSGNGILVLPLVGTESFYSLQLKRLNQNIINTLGAVFPKIKVIPGLTNIILSANDIKTDFSIEKFDASLKKYNPSTIFINPAFLTLKLNSPQENWYWESINPGNNFDINYDLAPTATFYSLSLWNAKTNPGLDLLLGAVQKINIKIILISLFLLLCVSLLLKNNKYFCLNYIAATSGFSAMVTNLILIISLQAYFGFIYSKFVILSGIFMLGLSIGAIILLKTKYKSNDIEFLVVFEIFIILFTVLSGLLLNTHGIMREWVFYLLSIIFGMGFGAEFATLNNVYLRDRSSQHIADIYKLDLLGSSCGAICAATFLMPILGTNKTFLIIILLKLFGVILIYKKSKTN